MSGHNYIQFETSEALVFAAIDTTLRCLSDAIEARNRGTLLCAGGSTPGPVYKGLSKTQLDWARVKIGLTDERWVPADHDGSNFALLNRTLRQNAGAQASFYPMVTDPDLSARDEASKIDALYREHLLPADMMILGMGPDAHTLSWFAGADGLDVALAQDTKTMVTAITANKTETTGAYTVRQTLTRNAVQGARNILLLITGDEKRGIFETSTPDTPIGHLLDAAGDRLTTYWAP